MEVIVGQREWEIWDVDCAISSLARLHVPIHKNEKGKTKMNNQPSASQINGLEMQQSNILFLCSPVASCPKKKFPVE